MNSVSISIEIYWMIMIIDNIDNQLWISDYDIEFWTDDELWIVYQYLPVSTNNKN